MSKFRPELRLGTFAAAQSNDRVADKPANHALLANGCLTKRDPSFAKKIGDLNWIYSGLASGTTHMRVVTSLDSVHPLRFAGDVFIF